MVILILVFDPRLDGATAAVATHMFGQDGRTQFWEYLLWAVSPLALMFGILGARALSESRLALLGAVLLGCAGPMAFYFHATTTPRYFLLITAPIAIVIAVGMSDVAKRLRGWKGPGVAWLAVLGLGTLHVFVGLGQFPANDPRAIITDARIMTHDGPMPTGALLYDTYLRNGFLSQSFRNPGFGKSVRPNWEGVTFTRALEELERRRDTEQTVLLLFDAGWDHVFHFHAQVAGATYVSREPGDPSAPFASETWLEVGDVSLMTIRYGGPDYANLTRFDVAEGDEVWITGDGEFPEARTEEKLPSGLGPRPVDSFDPRIRVFRVEATGS